MRFLIDEQLPPALAVQLRGQGHDAVHVIEIGLSGAPDDGVLREAVRRGAVLVTKDGDFLALRSGPPPILWIRFGNVSNVVHWALLGPQLPQIVAAIEAGEMLVEVVRGD
jgi:predicted nuclease of predicted toxin-antitoxin system